MQRLSFNHAFDIVWKRVGRPLLYLVANASTWSLPVGVSFDKVRQEFIDSSEVAVLVDMSSYQTSIPYLPMTVSQTLMFTLMGTHQTTTAQALVLWEEGRESALRAGWGIRFRNKYKTVTDIAYVPELSEPFGILISLGDKE